MSDYISVQEFIGTHGLSQKELSYLLYVIINNMEKIGLEYFDRTTNWIKMPDSNPKKIIFKEVNPEKDFSEEQKNEIAELNQKDEQEKMRQICDLILDCLNNGRALRRENLYEELMQDYSIIKEFKTLLKSALSESTVLTFKLFSKRLLEVHDSFGKNNLFDVYGEQNMERENEAIISIPCNYCGGVSLEPMYKLNECECYFHKDCFENTIIETIELKELGILYELAIPCSKRDCHLHYKDLKILVMMSRERFTLPSKVKMMIQYYYLNWHSAAAYYLLCGSRIKRDNSGKLCCDRHKNFKENRGYCKESYCSCGEKHKKVDIHTKKPYRLCNSRCSFCGDRWEEECLEFTKCLNWS